MADPFSAAAGITAYAPSIVGGTGTTCKIFPSNLGPGFGNGGNPLSLAPSSTLGIAPTYASGTPAAQVLIRGTGEYEQMPIVCNASGYVYVHGASPTINFLLQKGTSLTYNAAGQTTVATLASAQSLTTANTYPWALSVSMQGDSVSGVLQLYSATFACNGVSGTVTLTDLTGINLTTTGLPFVIGITFGVSDAANVAALSYFNLTSK